MDNAEVISEILKEQGCPSCGSGDIKIRREGKKLVVSCSKCGGEFKVKLAGEFTLSACPFCGSSDVMPTWDEDGDMVILCKNEICQAMVQFITAENDADAVEAWNKRADKQRVGVEMWGDAHIVTPYKHLRSCPFCGNINVAQVMYTDDPEPVGKKEIKLPHYSSAITCPDCQNYTMFGPSNGLKYIVDRWNLRDGKERL